MNRLVVGTLWGIIIILSASWGAYHLVKRDAHVNDNYHYADGVYSVCKIDSHRMGEELVVTYRRAE